LGQKTINNEILVLTAVLKSARLWASLKDSYEPLTVSKRGPGQALTPEQTARLIETAKTKDRWFVALCATVLAYATGCRSGEIKKLQIGDLNLSVQRPSIRLPAENTKNRSEREPALNDLGVWAVRQLLQRAALIGAVAPVHYLLPADLSKHTKKSDPLRGRTSDYVSVGFVRARFLISRQLWNLGVVGVIAMLLEGRKSVDKGRQVVDFSGLREQFSGWREWSGLRKAPCGYRLVRGGPGQALLGGRMTNQWARRLANSRKVPGLPRT